MRNRDAGSRRTSLLTLALVVALRMAVAALSVPLPVPRGMLGAQHGCRMHTHRLDAGSFPKVELFIGETKNKEGRKGAKSTQSAPPTPPPFHLPSMAPVKSCSRSESCHRIS